MFDLQVLVCLKCCWSVWACETRRPSASKPLRLPDCPDECTSFLAFPDPLFRQQSNDWKRMINTTHLAKFKFKKKKCEIFSFDDNSFVYHQVCFVCLFVYFIYFILSFSLSIFHVHPQENGEYFCSLWFSFPNHFLLPSLFFLTESFALFIQTDHRRDDSPTYQVSLNVEAIKAKFPQCELARYSPTPLSSSLPSPAQIKNGGEKKAGAATLWEHFSKGKIK